jgi:hypothetical protein
MPAGLRPAPLRDVVLPAPLAVDRRSRLAQHRVGGQPARAPRLVDRRHERGPLTAGCHQHHSGPVGRDPPAHVQRQRADQVAGGAGRRLDADPRHAAPHVLGPCGEGTGRLQHLSRPQLRQLLLHLAQPGDGGGDPLRHLVGRHLEGRGHLREQHVLAGRPGVGVQADQPLDPADAGADRAL